MRAHAAGLFVGGSPLDVKYCRATRTGKFVFAEAAGAEPLVADRDVLSAWEQLTLATNSDGSIGLRAVNGRYVCAEDAGAGSLIANRDSIGPWESFDLL